MKTAIYASKIEAKTQGWKKETEPIWYILEADFYMPDKRKRDNSNMYKLLLDALEGVVYFDDYFVKPRTMKVTLDRINPRVEVTVYPETYIKE